MDLENTMRYHSKGVSSAGQQVTVFDSDQVPRFIDLVSLGKNAVFFGRAEENDVVLSSHLVSRDHGRFVLANGKWYIEDRAAYKNNPSTNGLIYNNTHIIRKELCDGDIIRIDDVVETISNGVLFVVSSSQSQNKWHTVLLRSSMIIGRNNDCDITLPHISVSQHHAKIAKEGENYYISDLGSTNGVIVNDKRISSKTLLHEKDVIVITNSKLIFSSKSISYCCYQSGITVEASDIVITRKQRWKKMVTCNHVNLDIQPGELVSIIGGSGAGKSTVLNAMCGYLKPSGGSVYINGVDLYKNFDSLKKLIGYVPQSDIVYDNLTLYDMLSYAARLRLPEDATENDYETAITRAISTVDLDDKKNSYIKNLSGGQRKRASIAVELLSDPNLLFLDEPASGLDPGTERSLMQSLKAMADSGKTVILVTHSTLQLKLCNKIVFMGRGGRLCFCGPYDEALVFFGVYDIVDIYSMISEHSAEWDEKYRAKTNNDAKPLPKTDRVSSPKQENLFSQLRVLCSRYFKLIIHDRQRLLLLIAQAPVLALLISFVASGSQFEQYEMTNSLLFALSCSAFWVGMLNAIQEVCKERTILRREYMTGLRLISYLVSKIVVLGFLCLVQSFLITGVFALLIGLPETSVVFTPFIELLITTFLTSVSSAAMGLFVSSLFSNPDRAMTVAPILLLPQILFSGLIFKLEGATEFLSWIAICRWSMEGYGTTADLNSLPLRLQQEGVMIPHEAEDFFTFSVGHIFLAWGILLLFTVLFLFLARMMLNSIRKDKS